MSRHTDGGNRLCERLRICAPVLVLMVAAALRIWGLRWGLPNAVHDYSYHPDEFLIATAAFGSIYVGHSLDPRIYTYPSLFIYLSAVAIGAAFAYGAAPALANVYLAARVVSVVVSVAAVGATWWAGGVLFGPTAGMLAAVALAVAPMHAQHSHFATVDAPCTLFVALALGFAGLALTRGTWRDYVLAGATSGLAAGTKYNAGLVIFAPVAAFLLRDGAGARRAHVSRLAACLGCAVVAFVVSTPGSVLWPSEFLAGLLYEARHAATGHGLVFVGTGSGFAHHLTSSLWYGLGPGLTVLFVLSVLWAVYVRDRRALVLMSFLIPYYVLISLAQVRFARYTLPMFPAVALLVGWLISDRCRALSGGRSLWRCLWAGMVGLIFLSTLTYSCLLSAILAGHDPRDQAARWLFAHVPNGSRVGVPEVPWFYSPPLSKSLGFGTLDQRQEATREAPYQIVVFSECEEHRGWWTDKPPPEWVIVSDYEVEDALRLRGNKSIGADERALVRRITGNLDLVEKHYHVVRRFGPPWSWAEGLPHDMRYASPAISIYRLSR